VVDVLDQPVYYTHTGIALLDDVMLGDDICFLFCLEHLKQMLRGSARRLLLITVTGALSFHLTMIHDESTRTTVS
jgi:hypothetical protein